MLSQNARHTIPLKGGFYLNRDKDTHFSGMCILFYFGGVDYVVEKYIERH